MPRDGKGRKKICIVGEAPGREEDKQGRPFVGSSGQMVWDELEKLGVGRKDCWIINSCSCHPAKNKLPPKSIAYCRPLVAKNIEETRPRVIILLGDSAVKSVLGWLWKDADVGGIARWAGWHIPSQQLNAWVCPTYHPASFLHGEDEDRNDEVRKMLWQQHLRSACKLTKSRPWKESPDWKSKVRVELDIDAAAKEILGFIGKKPIAWDWESTGLKPFNKDLEIYSCAISDGQRAISYPWIGNAVDATTKFLESDTPKIGWNVHHEELWGLNRLGININNWVGDGMLDAHLLDNRPNICSLDFQAMAVLGFGDFKSSTDRYLKAEGNHAKNRIQECPLPEMLMRGGLDALLEFQIWHRQRCLIGRT